MRKSKKEKRLVFATSILGILLVGSCAVSALGYQQIKRYESNESSMKLEMAANQQTVYVATSQIKQGDQLLEGTNIALQNIYSGLDTSIYMTEEQVGYKALVDIPLGDAVQLNMIGENDISTDERDYEMDVVTLMTNQENNDIVDVRIMFPDGSDYIVLSKKTIRNLSLENSIFYTYLDEDEILRMASATIDAYQTSGTKIYTTRYVQPTLQDESIPFYPVKDNVIDLLHNDPNILEIAQETLNSSARADLESRLASVTDQDSAAIVSAQDTITKNQQNVLESSTDTEESAAGADSASTEEAQADDSAVTAE